MRKLCYFINSDWYFDLHWIDRAIASRDAGYEIHIISHFIDDNIINKFKTFGFICHNVTLDAQSFNALVFFRTYHDVQKIIKNIKPDLLHCITIKPCLIGGVLAKKFNLPVIVSFVGLGRVFSSDSMPLKLLRQFTIAAYKYIASNKRCIFMFEHDRDRKKLAKLVGLEEQQTIVIDGAGINPEIYKYSLEQNHDVPVVLFASRMLWSKGLGDLIEAKKILRSKNIHFTLNVAGILVENDKDAISLQVIENWHQQGLINWLGRSNNVCDLIEQSNIVALPSVYSEGVPRILLEASSVGRACIAYDVGGCDSLIIDNDNGIIVKSNSPEELADKLAFLLSNPKARVEMGIKGRKRIQDKFSSGMIISKTLKTEILLINEKSFAGRYINTSLCYYYLCRALKLSITSPRSSPWSCSSTSR